MIAYCDTPSGKNQLNNGGYVPYGPLTDWHGTRIGTYWITNTYRNNLGANIECIAATIDGQEYYGRKSAHWSTAVQLRKKKG